MQLPGHGAGRSFDLHGMVLAELYSEKVSVAVSSLNGRLYDMADSMYRSLTTTYEGTVQY